jgi:AICAR transformylase/IMP cyclohydrolase PurH
MSLDMFFPFTDGIEAEADKAGMAMVFTETKHFGH